MTSAYFTGVPLVVLGGRAPTVNWGRGGLQELDHVPLLAPVTKPAATAGSGEAIGPVLLEAARTALTPHRGPVFVDVPMDVIFSPATAEVSFPPPAAEEPDPAAVDAVARLVAAAERPAFVVGGDVYFGRAEAALARAAAALRCRSSPTAWAAAACPPTTRSPSPGSAGCCARRPTSSS